MRTTPTIYLTLTALLGCGPSTPGPVAVGAEGQRVAIEGFDCGVDLETKQNERLRAGNLGGPDGAAWNWRGPLTCTAAVSTTCQGSTQVRLTIKGRKRKLYLVSDASVEGPGKHPVTLTLADDAWHDELVGAPGALYKTARLELEADAQCGGKMLRAEDGFEGKFSEGE